jgi:hypothetical protein
MNFKLFLEQNNEEVEIYDFKRGEDEGGMSITDAMYVKYKNKKYLLLQFYSSPNVFMGSNTKLDNPLFIGIIVHTEKGKGWEPMIMTKTGEEEITGASFYEGFAHKKFLNIREDFYKVLEKALINENGRKKLLAKFSLKPSTREHFGDIVAN